MAAVGGLGVMDNRFYKPPELPRLISRPLFCFVLLVCQLGLVAQVSAQSSDQINGLDLRSSPKLIESISPSARPAMPTYMWAEEMSGRPDLDMVLQGNAQIRRADSVIRADRVEYFQPDDLAKAIGSVHLNRSGNLYQGPRLELKVDANQGFFLQPKYQFLANQAHGQASRVDFLDEKRALIHDATYTTCRREPGPSWLPDWLLRAASLDVDSDEEVAVAKNVQLDFKGATIMALPAMSFALSDKRRSGFLSPTFAADTVSGTEVTVPYYLNIAPNRDLTLYPTLMSKRGVNLGGEFRYLEQGYNGRLRADYLPQDPLRERDRWGTSFLHQGMITTGVSGVGNLGLNLNLNQVSDDDYWRDFPRGSPSLIQRLLPSTAALSWGRGQFSSTLTAQRWQTLQDPTAPIVPPYDRLPQWMVRYKQPEAGNFDVDVVGDYTQFQSDRLRTGQPNAQRSFMLAQISRPWLAAAGYITPTLKLHSRTYSFDAPLDPSAADSQTSATRSVPTFSLDGGLVFERNAGLFGRNFTQTLEPRLYYVNTPYVEQNYLPNYDAGANDFNFASIFSDNSFVGNDRIADNNLLTAGVTTRLLNPNSGAESARFAIAQRYRFADQKVTLPGGLPAQSGLSDLLLGAGFNWDQRWAFESLLQYNLNEQRSVRSTVNARYQPGNYRVLNMAYRFQNLSELVDVGWQWPINDLWGDKGRDLGPGRGQGAGRWYGVGRLNYSLQTSQLIDSIVGFEYDAGCWLGRVVMQRLQTGLVSSNQSIMFQLELVGFSRLGIDPLSALKNNIPRYQYLREQISSTPSRFSQYD